MLKILERRMALQLLVFYSLFVLPLLLGGIELYLFQRDALQESAQRADLGLAKAISLEVETTMQSATGEVVYLSKSQAASQLDLYQLSATFSANALSHPDMSLYVICDPSGKVLLQYPSDQNNLDRNVGCSEYIQAAMSSDRPFISSGWISPVTNTYVASVGTRITNQQNQVVGIMVIHLSLEKFTSRLLAVRQELTNSSEVRIWIVDGSGRSIANTEGIPPETNLYNRLPGLKNALERKSGNLIAPQQNRDWLDSYVPIPATDWAVIIERPTDITFATVISFQNSLIIALIILVVGASFFWFVMHGWIVAPITRLAHAATLIKPDQQEKITDDTMFARERVRIDEIGKLITAFSTMEDEIHSLFRKSDEQSLVRLQTLDAIMRSMDEGVILEDSDGQIIYANHNFTQFVGISSQNIQNTITSDRNASEMFKALLEDPETYYEAVSRAENGSGPEIIEFYVPGYYNEVGQFVPIRRAMRLHLFYVRDLTGQIIGRGKIFQDVTQQNEAEQVKKNLLAIVSHELRTPLTAIKGYATSLLETDIEVDALFQADFLQRIVNESDRMAELVTNLLEMSQLEAGTIKLYPSLCRLDTLIEWMIAGNEGTQIQVEQPKDIPLLYIDVRRIQVVLRNLLENARRHAGANVSIEILVKYEQALAENGLSISIADNGVGIPPELTERIFDHFYQVDGGRERSSHGVGLGLAICRGFIEAHGGRIWAENRTDGKKGAVFHIWLPPKLLRSNDTQEGTFALHKAL